MPTPNPISLSVGIQSGENRFSLIYSVNSFINPDQKDQITKSLEKWPDDLSDHFVSLFAENCTVAILVRSRNNEPALDEEQIFAFLSFSAWFFNSFKHK